MALSLKTKEAVEHVADVFEATASARLSRLCFMIP